jgi:hypothetical protein
VPLTRFRVKTVALAGLAVLSVGGMAAAATGVAPAATERAARPAARTADGQAAHALGNAATMTGGPAAAPERDHPGSGRSGDHAAGPDLSGAARQGLCRAWGAGQGDVHGRRMDAAAFQALVAAAGGADQVPAFCGADAAATPERRPVTPSSRAPRTPPPAPGPDERPGEGQGSGGPPTT